jgi:uncharacterized protein YeaO (DUF488 family)
MTIALKRVYEDPARSDGARILVDGLWPRGVSKDSAKLTAWLKDIAPSDELRKWYHSHPSQWLLFRRKYLQELRGPVASGALDQLYEVAARHARVTLLFGSRNVERNNATVLKELMEGSRKPPSTSGAIRASALKRGRARMPR